MVKNQLILFRYMSGAEIGTMTLDELQALEKNLEILIFQIRSAKVIYGVISFNFNLLSMYIYLFFYLFGLMNIYHRNFYMQMEIMFQEIQLLKNKVSLNNLFSFVHWISWSLEKITLRKL